jgi:glycosyltransferase involved in cell wall biosynthesis
LSSTPEGLADDVKRLRADKDLRRRLGDAARQHAERSFEVSAVAEKVERLYLDLIGERR